MFLLYSDSICCKAPHRVSGQWTPVCKLQVFQQLSNALNTTFCIVLLLCVTELCVSVETGTVILLFHSSNYDLHNNFGKSLQVPPNFIAKHLFKINGRRGGRVVFNCPVSSMCLFSNLHITSCLRLKIHENSTLYGFYIPVRNHHPPQERGTIFVS